MKILYSIQATGNGHIARAEELYPVLSKYGQVDTFLSGSNRSLPTQFPVTYTSKGLSLFYGAKGGLNYWKMCKDFSPVRILKDAAALPVHKYDAVLCDFESITTLACQLKGVPFIHFGHQASFQSDLTPRPPKMDFLGECILKNFAKSEHKIGLHFKCYDNFIYSPVIKEQIEKADPVNKGHVTVYLSHYEDEVIEKLLSPITEITFHVFSKQVKNVVIKKNIHFFPVSNLEFSKSMIDCDGVITGAGFETPAEALYLGKKLMCIPIQGQYEQYCNAAALKEFQVPIYHHLNADFTNLVKNWLSAPPQTQLTLQTSKETLIEKLIEKAIAISNFGEASYPIDFKFSVR